MKPRIDSKLQTHRSSWFTAAQCQAYYGVPYQFREIQIHWWDDPARKPSHDGVVNYQANKTGGSVNYVASAGRVTFMVPEEHCAFTTQGGNPYGIKIECAPYGTDADYQTIAWLVADIWKRRGYMPLVPHNKYFNTACPGTLDLGRIEREAKAILNGGDDMTKVTTGLNRIIHTEMEGWPYHETHAGKYDSQIIAAWNGKDLEEMIWSKWNKPANAAWRENRVKALAAYPSLKASVEQLSSSIKQKDVVIADQAKEIESLRAQVGDNSKWETLKALVRELVGR